MQTGSYKFGFFLAHQDSCFLACPPGKTSKRRERKKRRERRKMGEGWRGEEVRSDVSLSSECYLSLYLSLVFQWIHCVWAKEDAGCLAILIYCMNSLPPYAWFTFLIHRLSIYESICLPVHLSTCLSRYLSIEAAYLFCYILFTSTHFFHCLFIYLSFYYHSHLPVSSRYPMSKHAAYLKR